MVTKNGNGMDSKIRRVLSQQEQQAAINAFMVQRGIDRCGGAIVATMAFLGPQSSWRPEDRLGSLRHALALTVANADNFKTATQLDLKDPFSAPVVAMHDHAIATFDNALKSIGGVDSSPSAQCVALGKSLVYAAFLIAGDGTTRAEAKPEPAMAMRVFYALAVENAAAMSDEAAAKTADLLGDKGPAFLASAVAARPSFEAIRDAIKHGLDTLDAAVQGAMPKVRLPR